MGALIQGRWYMHVLSLLACAFKGTCMYYIQPLTVHGYVHVSAVKSNLEAA